MAVEHFEYRGQMWRRVRSTPIRKFCVAGDLAQTTDFTAAAVIEHQRTPLGTFTATSGKMASPSAASPANSAPQLKVDTVRMIAASCSN